MQSENTLLMQERRELERLVGEMRAEIDAAGSPVIDDDEPGGDGDAVGSETSADCASVQEVTPDGLSVLRRYRSPTL